MLMFDQLCVPCLHFRPKPHICGAREGMVGSFWREAAMKPRNINNP